RVSLRRRQRHRGEPEKSCASSTNLFVFSCRPPRTRIDRRAVSVGFFTDTTVCIGCKACEVACKQWNQLPDDGFSFSGMSYDNTVQLGASTWRHVAFIEKPSVDDKFSWLMMSDVCKHCETAACLDACPTGSIIRTEFDSV